MGQHVSGGTSVTHQGKAPSGAAALLAPAGVADLFLLPALRVATDPDERDDQ